MKHFFTLFALAAIMLSCNKPDDRPLDEGMSEEGLKKIIEEKKIDGVEYCCTDCACDPKFGEGSDFDFPGDGTIRIEDQYYEINRIFSTREEVLTKDWQKFRVLLLYFN